MSAKPAPASSFWPRAKKTNVRRLLHPLIGREDVLDAVDSAFANGARLVTLLGPPGIGKTRVALEVHTQALDRRVSSFLCDLSEVRDVGALEHAVASYFPVPRAEPGDGKTSVERALASAGPVLLILDNFEQLVGCARAVTGWCEAAPDVRVLITSRERLAIGGEHVVELEPLACPSPGEAAARIAEAPAVRLFVARAEAAGARVGDDLPSVAALVRKLDGLPLAIELAAARARVFSPRELAARLDQGFELIAHPKRAEDRHATLASAIAWSWNLLSAEERSALATCTLFSGSFTVRAAEEVVGAGATSALELLGALRDKSLIHSTADGRLALYLSIRDFAAATLGGEEAEKAGLRHASFFARLARPFNCTRTLQGSEPDRDLRAAIGLERDNLVAALSFMRAHIDRSQALADDYAELSLALAHLRSMPTELARESLDFALSKIERREDDVGLELTSRLLLARQGLLVSMGLFADSHVDLERLLASELSPGVRAFTLCMQGIVFWYEGRPNLALESHRAARVLLDGLDLPRLHATNLACEGRIHGDFGDATMARELDEAAASCARRVGDGWLEALGLGNLAQVEQETQSFSIAADLLQQALARFREANEEQYTAIYSSIYGDLLFEWGKLDEARAAYTAAARFLDRWSASRGSVQLYAAWGALEACAGNTTLAATYFERARAAAAHTESPTVRVIFEAHHAHLELLRARDSGDAELFATSLARWRKRVHELAHGAKGSPGRQTVKTSVDARFAVRMLERSIIANDNAVVAPLLTTADDGTWFELGGGARVDLRRRGSLRKILRALARHHGQAPDTALDRDALLAQGWPGEKLHPDAASKRLRVAIATLRRLGLRDVLLTRDDGYLIDPAVAVVLRAAF